VFFDQPVKLHTWFDPGRTTQMLFLITGPYADMSVVLLGDQGQYRAGAPVLKTLDPIREALKSLGFSPIQESLLIQSLATPISLSK